MNRVFQEGFKPFRGSPKAERVQRFADRLSRRHDQAAYCFLRDRAERSAKAIRAAADLRWRGVDRG